MKGKPFYVQFLTLCLAGLLPLSAYGQDDVEKRMEGRLRALEQELAEVREELSKQDEVKAEEKADRQLGFQLQLRFEYFTLAHNRRNDFFAQENGTGADDAQFGFGGGIGLRLPLWINITKNVDIIGMLNITYRQNDAQPKARSVITGKRVTTSWVNIIAGPQIRIKVSDRIRPFVFIGGNINIETPPTDGVTYLDAGISTGLGVDVKLTKKLSAGADYQWTFMGAGDQERSDYGSFGVFIAFNF